MLALRVFCKKNGQSVYFISWLEQGPTNNFIDFTLSGDIRNFSYCIFTLGRNPTWVGKDQPIQIVFDD